MTEVGTAYRVDEVPERDEVGEDVQSGHFSAIGSISREAIAGRSLDEVSREALGLLDEMEELLSEKVLNYAVGEA